MSTICRDCEAIVVADDDVPADLVRIAMANADYLDATSGGAA